MASNVTAQGEMEKWKLKTESGNFGFFNVNITHVAALSNNQLLLITSSPNSGNKPKLLIFSLSNSQHDQSPVMVQQTIEISGLNNVRCIAVGKDDKLFALYSLEVKVFNKQHQLIHEFTPGQGSNGKPSCLAVDDSDMIAVGYRGKNEISLHNLDGSLIRRLSAPMIDDYLTMYNQCLIYTTHNDKGLECVDYHGASVFSADMEKYGRPTCVCCDSDGSIYVAGYPLSKVQGTILHYSPGGKYIGCVIKDCGDPCGITFTSGGDLAVATEKFLKIYERV